LEAPYFGDPHLEDLTYKGDFMKHVTRLALLACAGITTLAFAGSALAVPKLTIGGKLGLGDSGAVVQFTEDKEDAAPAKIQIYAPQGYTGVFTASAGTQLGTVHADLQALSISPDAIIQADGVIQAASPATYAANTCAPGNHTAVWLLHVTVSGQTIDVPVYVDSPALTADPLANGAPVKLTLCLSSPYAEAGAARAPFGVKLINAALTLNEGVFTNPSTRGEYPWRAIVTPYTVNSGNPNAGGTVEARAFVRLPTALNLSAKLKTTRKKVKVHGKKVTRVTNVAILTGSLSENLVGIGGIKVTILSGPTLAKLKSRGTVTTTNGGGFTRQLGLTAKTSFQAKATVPARDITSTGCSTATPGIPCVSATTPGFSVVSALVTVTPKKK
jgi:hypothetical protein